MGTLLGGSVCALEPGCVCRSMFLKRATPSPRVLFLRNSRSSTFADYTALIREMEHIMPHETCLVVDDESSVRAFVRTILERNQFRVVEAENVGQAAQTVQNVGDAIDLIVSDIRMPGGDGITFASSVRESFPLLPIILVSGCAEPPWERYPSTSFVFVPKPFLPATLLSAITQAKEMMALRKKVISPD